MAAFPKSKRADWVKNPERKLIIFEEYTKDNTVEASQILARHKVLGDNYTEQQIYSVLAVIRADYKERAKLDSQLDKAKKKDKREAIKVKGAKKLAKRLKAAVITSKSEKKSKSKRNKSKKRKSHRRRRSSRSSSSSSDNSSFSSNSSSSPSSLSSSEDLSDSTDESLEAPKAKRPKFKEEPLSVIVDIPATPFRSAPIIIVTVASVSDTIRNIIPVDATATQNHPPLYGWYPLGVAQMLLVVYGLPSGCYKEFIYQPNFKALKLSKASQTVTYENEIRAALLHRQVPGSISFPQDPLKLTFDTTIPIPPIVNTAVPPSHKFEIPGDKGTILCCFIFSCIERNRSDNEIL